MRRILTPAMTTIWAGAFHDPWAQKKPDELGDIRW